MGDLADGSKKGWDSMSPVVPPISVMTIIRPGFLLHREDKGLDFIGDVGDHLDRLPQVFPPPLLGEDIPVDLAGGQLENLFRSSSMNRS